MRLRQRVISIEWLFIFSIVLGCRALPEKLPIDGAERTPRIESAKDAPISKAVIEKLLADKTVDLTRVNVNTTDGAVELTGVVASLEARDHALKLAWQAPGVKSVVNHLHVEK